jgi:hypothetical protein
MFDPSAERPADTREALLQIFGFASGRGRGGPLTALAEMARRERFAMMFAAEILKGATPKSARDEACNRGEEADADDRTLRRRLASYFGLGKSGWKKVIIEWLFDHPRYRSQYPELPDLSALIVEYRGLFPEVRKIRVVDRSGRIAPRASGQ